MAFLDNRYKSSLPKQYLPGAAVIALLLPMALFLRPG